MEESKVYDRQEYAKSEFWNDRFRESKTSFDWYCQWDSIKPHMKDVPKEANILMVGCGNSKLSEEMYADGYTNILNIDISSVVIEQMKE
jgi:EEF1A lysine methyltransferase 4